MRLNDNKKNNRLEVKAIDIKSNIVTYITLYSEIRGILNLDYVDEEFVSKFVKEGYKFETGTLVNDDIFALEKKLDYTNVINNESVIRFFRAEEDSQIILSRLFVIVNISHKLKNLESIMNDFDFIMKSLVEKNKYVAIKNIALRKNNSIVVSSAGRILECLETRLNNNEALEIQRINGAKNIKLLMNKSTNCFVWDNIEFLVEKGEYGGVYESESKDIESYEVLLDILGTLHYSNVESPEYRENFFSEQLKSINDSIFEIFKMNISKSFLKDMKIGKSNKIIMGLNSNE